MVESGDVSFQIYGSQFTITRSIASTPRRTWRHRRGDVDVQDTRDPRRGGVEGGLSWSALKNGCE